MAQSVAELATRFRIADPKPGHCSACLTSSGPDVEFVDFDCLVDHGTIVEPGSMAILDAMDGLYLCRSCVEQAAELLEFRPGLHRRHLEAVRERDREIAELTEQNHHLKAALQATPGGQ